MRRIVHNLKISSAQNHVVLICVFFLFISMLIIGAYMSVSMYSQAFEATSDRMRLYADKSVENLEQSFSFVSNTTMAVATTDIVFQWIDNPSLFEKNAPDYYNNLAALKAQTRHILAYSNAWQNKFISYIAIFCNDELLMYSYTKPLAESAIIKSSQQAYDELMSRQPAFVSDIHPFVGDRQIFHARILKPIYTSAPSLVIMIATDESVLQTQYTRSPVMDSSQIYLIDDAGRIFSSNRADMLGQTCDPAIMEGLNTGASQVELNGQTSLLLARPLADKALIFASLVPMKYVTGQALGRLPALLLICFGLCLALLAVGTVISLRSTVFIRDLAAGMEQVKAKNYDVQIRRYNNYAVDILGASFNSMTNAMKVLVKDTYESKIMLREMQLTFLQQQVNPHFLFNILLTIQIKARLCSDETIFHMLESLSGFLRAGLYASNNIYTTLEEELQCIRFYLYLQQQRFGDRLVYELDVPDSLLGLRLPRLSVEPLVENAIVHGMENHEKPVHIRLTAVARGDDVTITVCDDGTGFDMQAVAWHQAPEYAQDGRDKIGLQNTNHRLKLLYGEAYALSIDSAPGQGTRVTVRIPRIGGQASCTG